jgi:hypothetical protein
LPASQAICLADVHFTFFFTSSFMRIPTFFRSFLAAAVVLLAAGSAQQALAQAPGTGGPTPTPPTTPTEVPLDGGASLLLAGSVAYGLRKLRQRRQK